MHHPRLEELVERDPRYTYEAYEFVFEALEHTQEMLGRAQEVCENDEEESELEDDSEVEVSHHVSGPELLYGIRDLALREFGLMARTVFRTWGINRTGDFGNIVFNLIEANLMSKTEQDTQHDFEDVYDMDQDLLHDYQITLEEDE